MTKPDFREKPVSFSDLAGWENDDHVAALFAFAALTEAKKSHPTTRALGIDGVVLQKLARKARALIESNSSKKDQHSDHWARSFFETHFEPVEVKAVETPGDDFTGFLTGYFEPEVRASRAQSAEFPIPIYKRPHDLIDLTDDNRPASLPDDYRFGRLVNGEIVAFFDRQEINAGALNGRGLEFAFVEDLVTAFFVHVQGASKLLFDDGTSQRITFTAKAGHPYTSLGKVLCKLLDMDPSDMTADFLADWMRKNPKKLDEFLAHNRSYIFFEEENQSRPDQGPVAAAKLPLIEGRSFAVDRFLHTFGTPVWVETEEPLPGGTAPLQRLMMLMIPGRSFKAFSAEIILPDQATRLVCWPGACATPARWWCSNPVWACDLSWPKRAKAAKTATVLISRACARKTPKSGLALQEPPNLCAVPPIVFSIMPI